MEQFVDIFRYLLLICYSFVQKASKIIFSLSCHIWFVKFVVLWTICVYQGSVFFLSPFIHRKSIGRSAQKMCDVWNSLQARRTQSMRWISWNFDEAIVSFSISSFLVWFTLSLFLLPTSPFPPSVMLHKSCSHMTSFDVFDIVSISRALDTRISPAAIVIIYSNCFLVKYSQINQIAFNAFSNIVLLTVGIHNYFDKRWLHFFHN